MPSIRRQLNRILMKVSGRWAYLTSDAVSTKLQFLLEDAALIARQNWLLMYKSN